MVIIHIYILFLLIEARHWHQVNVIKTTKDKQIPIRGGEPPRRYGHTCLAYKNKIYMFGGRNDDDGSFRVMECFDANRSMWLKVIATAEGCTKPKSRDGHAVCNHGKDMYMHGGKYSMCLYSCILNEYE